MAHARRQAILIVAVCAATAATIACRGSGKDTAASADAAPAPDAAPAAPAAPGDATPEDLTFTGAVAGHMTTAHKGGGSFCGALGPRFIADPIEGDVGDSALDFSVTIADGFKGPGAYTSGKELTPGSGVASVLIGLAKPGSTGKEFVNSTGANTVTVNADGRSGTVSADVHAIKNPRSVVHVSGAWRCPPD